MQGSIWIAMLRRIPAELHDALMLGLTTGAEIVVQQIIRMDSDFAIVRGRMAGSTAESRVLVVPYARLTFVAINKPLKEAEAQAIFASAAPIEQAKPLPEGNRSGLPAAPAENRPSAAIPGNGVPSAANPKPSESAAASSKPALASKSVLLARLRERLADKSK